MNWAVVFFTSLILATGYAVIRGAAPERYVAACFIVAGVATALLPRPTAHAYGSVFWGVVWVDTALLCALLLIALLADRYWPLWVAALQLVIMAMHGVRGHDTKIVPFAYWFLIGKIAYPQMALLAIGVSRHCSRLQQYEFDWTFQRHRAERQRRSARS